VCKSVRHVLRSSRAATNRFLCQAGWIDLAGRQVLCCVSKRLLMYRRAFLIVNPMHSKTLDMNKDWSWCQLGPM
jgi:hypothetical protein